MTAQPNNQTLDQPDQTHYLETRSTLRHMERHMLRYATAGWIMVAAWGSFADLDSVVTLMWRKDTGESTLSPEDQDAVWASLFDRLSPSGIEC